MATVPNPSTQTNATDHHHTHSHQGPPRAGHHHPRQPADDASATTSLPPNHRPRSDFTAGGDRHAECGSAPQDNTTSSNDQGDEEEEKSQPRGGHHHPMQRVGETGLPPNHRPREDFTREEGDVASARKEVAGSGNHFLGTNTDPGHGGGS